MQFSDVYEDEDGWFLFNLTLPSGDVISSAEFYSEVGARHELQLASSSEFETTRFINSTGYKFDTSCPICGRDADDTMSEHHLIPKCKKGKETVSLHRVCHDFIHATFTDKELAREYNTIALLMQDERMIKFGKWCAKKVANFSDPSIMSNNKNPNKRR